MEVRNRRWVRLNRELFRNMIFNITANVIPILLLQIILLPLLSRGMDSNEYGLVVTILAMLNVVPSTLGNTLNNIRLLHNNNYKKKSFIGDFNIILIGSSVVNLLIVLVSSIYYLKTYNSNTNETAHVLLIVLLSLLWMYREYFIVTFLIDLRYDKILINNLLLSFGYILGFVCFWLTSYWEFIYIIGYVLSDIHILNKSILWKESIVMTELFKNTCKEYLMYVISCIISRLVIYADKLLLYPILGGTVVTIYYVATLSSKVIVLLISPISNVILSHISKEQTTSKNGLFKVLIWGSSVCVVGYFGCLFFSEPVLRIIYPNYVDSAMGYIWLTTAIAMTRVLIGLINPFILRFLTMKWQVIINTISLLLYVSISMTLLIFWGLYGFCIGGLITNLVKIMIMLFIYNSANKV